MKKLKRERPLKKKRNKIDLIKNGLSARFLFLDN